MTVEVKLSSTTDISMMARVVTSRMTT